MSNPSEGHVYIHEFDDMDSLTIENSNGVYANNGDSTYTVYRETNQGYWVAHTTHLDLANVAAEALVSFPASNGYGGGVAFRAQSNGERYSTWLYVSNQDGWDVNSVVLFHNAAGWNGGWTELARSDVPAIGTTPQLLRAEAVGDNIKVLVNGVEYIDVTDTTITTGGDVGLGGWSYDTNDYVIYDQLKAFDLDPGEVDALNSPVYVRSDSYAGSSGTSQPFSSFQVDGENRLLVVVTGHWTGGEVTGVAFNTSENFTLHADELYFDANGNYKLWYLLNPTATTADVVVTSSASIGSYTSAVYLFTNVDQTNPFGFYDVDYNPTASQTTSASVTTGAVPEDLIFEATVAYQGTTTFTPGAGQTVLETTIRSGWLEMTSSIKEATSYSEAMSQSFGGSKSSTMVAVAIRPPSDDFLNESVIHARARTGLQDSIGNYPRDAESVVLWDDIGAGENDLTVSNATFDLTDHSLAADGAGEFLPGDLSPTSRWGSGDIGTLFQVLKTTDTAFLLTGGDQLVGYTVQGSALSPHDVGGTPLYYKNGVLLPSPTRDDLYDAYSVGEYIVASVRDLDIQNLDTSNFGVLTYPGGIYYTGNAKETRLYEAALTDAQHDLVISKLASDYSITLPTYLVSENLDGGGYELPWNEILAGASTVDEDSTTNVTEGTQNLEIVRSGGDAITWTSFAGNTVIDGFLHFRTSSVTINNTSIQIQDSSGTSLGTLSVRSDGQLRIGNGASNDTTASLSADTDYKIWYRFDFDAGTANAEFQTTETKVGSGSNYVSVAGGTTGVTAARLQIYCSNNATIYVDKIRVDDEAIGSNPQ